MSHISWAYLPPTHPSPPPLNKKCKFRSYGCLADFLTSRKFMSQQILRNQGLQKIGYSGMKQQISLMMFSSSMSCGNYPIKRRENVGVLDCAW